MSVSPSLGEPAGPSHERDAGFLCWFFCRLSHTLYLWHLWELTVHSEDPNVQHIFRTSCSCKSLHQPGWKWLSSPIVPPHHGGQAGPGLWQKPCMATPAPLSSQWLWVTFALLRFGGSLRVHMFSGLPGFNATPQWQKEPPGLSHRLGKAVVPKNMYSYEWGHWRMLLGVTSGLVDTGREALAGALLAV